MEEERKVTAVIHAENVDAEQRRRFNRELTVDEIIQILQNGSGGRPLLLKKRAKEDENVVVEYKKDPA